MTIQKNFFGSEVNSEPILRVNLNKVLGGVFYGGHLSGREERLMSVQLELW